MSVSGEFFAITMSDKMYYVNQSIEICESGGQVGEIEGYPPLNGPRSSITDEPSKFEVKIIKRWFRWQNKGLFPCLNALPVYLPPGSGKQEGCTQWFNNNQSNGDGCLQVKVGLATHRDNPALNLLNRVSHAS